MSDTPRTDAMASEVEHLGPGGRALYQGRLWSLAYALESELTATCAKRDALRTELLEVTEAMNAPAVNNIRTLAESIRILQAERAALRATVKDSLTVGSRLDAEAFREERDEARALLNGVLQDIRTVQAERDALRSLLERIVVAVDASGVGFASNSEDFWNAIDAAREKMK